MAGDDNRQAATKTAAATLDEAHAVVSEHGRTNTLSGLDTRLELGAATFAFAWLGIVVLHGVCAFYLTQLARVYWFLTHPYIEYFARIATGDRYGYLHHASVVIGLVAALHYWQLLSILWATLCARELAFPDDSSASIWRAIVRLPTAWSSTSRLESLTVSGHRFHKVGRIAHIVVRLYRFVFSRQGLLGVESRVFHTVFTVREVVEVVSQTFQAYRSSELLASRWLNDLFVALVVANCWSTPVLQHVFRRHEGRARLACLLLDAILNMGSSMAVPLAVFWPYYKALDPVSLLFPLELIYDNTWFASVTMETRLLFGIATPDAVSKLVPHVASYGALTSIATLLDRRGSCRRQTRVVADMQPRRTAAAAEHKDKAMTTNAQAHARTLSSGFAVISTAKHSRCRQAVVHLVFIAWGFALLALHLRAASRVSDSVRGCDQVTGAWFATAYPCAVFTSNCYRDDTTTPNEASWSHLDTETLMYLTIAHCTALTMPHALQRFPNLLGLQIHNSTLNEWSHANALSATKHTKLISFGITRTNMTRLPDGLGLLEPLPPSLLDIELSHTNLTALPADLPERWHALTVFYLEHSFLTEFPSQVLALGAPDVSLYGNRIENMPALPADAHLYSLELSRNPLTALPETIGSGAAVAFLGLEHTQVATLPHWLDTSVEDTAFLFDTPYCEDPATTTDDNRHVSCMANGRYTDGNVPVSVIDRFAPL